MTESVQGLSRAAIFTLGGTIAMTPSTAGGVTPTLSGRELLTAVPGLADVQVRLELCDFRQLPSSSLGFDDLSALSAAIRDKFADGVSGAVVTQGSDTIEETAYALDLRHTGPQPIVVTGAMRNPALASADGPANILAAIRTAVSGTARDLGCLVVFAEQIHAARRVRKTHSTSVTAFQSPNGGPLGYVTEGSVRILNRLPARPTVPPEIPGRRSRVVLVTAVLDDDGLLLALLDGRVEGVVVAGFGGGHVPPRWVRPLKELASRLPVVLTSRTGAGAVLEDTYDYTGSERDLLAGGLIAAGFLDPHKARILLQGLLAGGADGNSIATAFKIAGERTDSSTLPWPR